MKLPSLSVSGNTKLRQTAFGGYNHTLSAINGEIYDMGNLTPDNYPILSSRQKRNIIESSITSPHGYFKAGSIFKVVGTTLYVDGVSKGSLAGSDKQFAALGERVVIFPDKKIYENGELKNLESSYSASGLTGIHFKDGTYAGETAEANTIYHSGTEWSDYFNVGDAVTISGCALVEENNKTAIIREIEDDELRFYEGTFKLLNDDEYVETSTVTIKRAVPDLDFICSNDNRIWGCKDNTIYACKLGDPYNWNSFDGISTDSFSVDGSGAGFFTACVSYMGYPTFFKENEIVKMYGDRPSNFQISSSATLGVLDGFSRSLAVAGEMLFYMARVGIVAYSGGVPQSVFDNFGGQRFDEATAASDGTKYYVTLKNEAGYNMFVYDTSKSLWYKEDSLKIKYSIYDNGLYVMTEDAIILFPGALEIPDGAIEESAFVSFAEFGDFDYQTMDFKHLVRLRLRIEIGEASRLNVFLKCDSEHYEKVFETTQNEKGFLLLPIPINRCDHFRIMLECTGGFKLHMIEYEYYSGGRK